FDTDGTVNTKHINLTTASQQLAKDIQRNLRYFGIIARIYKYTSQGPNNFRGTMYHVNIGGHTSIRRFAKHIGFTIERKAKRLAALVNTSTDSSDLIPPEWRATLRRGKPGDRGDLRLLRDAGIRCDT